MSDSINSSPVHAVAPSASSPRQEPIGLQSSNLLKDMLYPLNPCDFMTQDFRRNAVHVQASTSGKKKKATENRFQPIIEESMYNLDTSELLKETSSDSIFVWLAAANNDKNKEGNSKTRDDNTKSTSSVQKGKSPTLVQSIELPDAESALALHQSAGGHALYCRAPPQVEQVLVSKLLRDTGLGCGQYDPTGESMTTLGRGEVEMFVTSKAGGTTDWHYDFQENFTLQLSGVKRWTLQRGTVTHPLRACTPHYNAPNVVESQLKAARLSAPDFVFDQPKPKTADIASSAEEGYNAEGPIEIAILYPGDVLYFPAGMWHKIEVLVPGVSINVSLMAKNYASVTCEALQHYLLQKDEWRQVVVHNPEAAVAATTKPKSNNGALNVLDHLKGLLKDLPDIIKYFEEEGGGAQSILPPVLLQPPNFHSVADPAEEDDNNDEGDNINEKDEGEVAKPPAKKARHHGIEDEEAGGSDEENPDDENEWDNVAVEDEDEEDNTIDACDFQYPSGSTKPCSVDSKGTKSLLLSHRIIRNPLASLMRLDEVARYYATLAGKEEENDKNELLFILNVNYAGVESHESSLRVVLRDDPEKQYLNKFYSLIRGESRLNGLKGEGAEALDCPSLIHCLLYYGFYTLVPGKNRVD